MDKLTIDDLDAIEVEAERAAPGPWEGIDPADFGSLTAGWDVNGPYTITDDAPEFFMNEPTAKFVAHSRANVPALCALARSQQAEIERLRDLAHRIATFKGSNPVWSAGDFEYLVELAGKMEGGK